MFFEKERSFSINTDLSFPTTQLVVLDASTGQPIRVIEQGDHYISAEGNIYSWSNQRIAAFTAESGALLWEIPL